MSGYTILVVDDDQIFTQLVSDTLRVAGFNVVVAYDGREALRLFYHHKPSLVLLDLALPDPLLDGLAVCRRIREVSEVPVIMLTAEQDPEEIVKCLEAGADDYVTKPYQRDVLIARVRANLRRIGTSDLVERSRVIYSDGYLTVNLDERRVFRDGEPIKLSPREYNLLAKLLSEAPRVVNYRDLLSDVWGAEYVDDIDYLRVYIWHLRRKLEKDPQNPVYIQNESGVGYRFERQI